MIDFSPEEFLAVLSEEEKTKCERLFDPRDREVYLLSRGWLRKLLASITGSPPAALIFSCTPNGKPYVAGHEEIHFSVAHTGDAFVIAFADSIRAGADIEKLDRCIAVDQLSDFIFSNAELQQYKHCREEERQEAAINCWTRKEALLKALGTGLSIPMNHVEVEFVPGATPKVLSVFGSEAESRNWRLESFDLFGNYRAALAVRGEVKSVQLFDLASPSAIHQHLTAELICN